jgi:hypothetical protein
VVPISLYVIHELEFESFVATITYHNNGARTFIKKELVRNDYELPEKSIRFFANIDNKKINIDISKLKLSN